MTNVLYNTQCEIAYMCGGVCMCARGSVELGGGMCAGIAVISGTHILPNNPRPCSVVYINMLHSLQRRFWLQPPKLLLQTAAQKTPLIVPE